MKIKLKIEAFGMKPGTTTEVSESVGKQMVLDGDAVEIVAKSNRKTVSNKALNAKG